MVVGVTGITGGIGSAVGKVFRDRGEQVVGFSRSGAGQTAVLDVTSDYAAVAEAISRSLPHGSLFDAWINLAGADILSAGARLRSFDERLSELWTCDVAGTIACCRAVLPHLKQHGSIVNVAWDEALTGSAGASAELYGTAKAAVIGYSMSLAKTLGSAYRVYVVSPGWVRTRWNAALNGEQQERLVRRSATQRWIDAEDVAEVIYGLIMSSRPSGEILRVAGQ